MTKNKIVLKAGGPAGAGVFTIGAVLARSLKNMGLNIFYTADYPSLIKGGHNACYVRADSEETHSHLSTIDVLVAIDKQTITKHFDELTQNGAIIYDSSIKIKNIDLSKREDLILIPVPMTKIGREIGNKIYMNMVSVGTVTALLGLDLEKVYSTLEKHFSKKGKENVLQDNKNAVKRGHDYYNENFRDIQFKIKINEIQADKRILITGNDAASLGAVKAGVKFVADYPMTPASSVLHFMAKYEHDFNIVVKQPESELAVINMLCGAAMTGVRSLAATSGGGFALMSEGLGMAGLSETPFVIIESQRTGPSTGMPTYTEQSDLRFVLHASQGEFPRLVVAPGDVDEAFFETFKMFNLSERVQTPGIVLLDKHISASAKTTLPFDTSNLKIERGKLMSDEDMKNAKEKVLRYKLTQDGISPRPIPGQPNGRYVSTSYEHFEDSSTAENSEMRIKQVHKRKRKMKNISKEEIAPKVYGDENADLTIVSWGSNKGMVLEAIKLLKEEGYNVNFLQILWIEPFPTEEVSKILCKSRKTLMVEQNANAQMCGLIREKTGFFIENVLLKYDGRPFNPEKIVEKVKELVKK